MSLETMNNLRRTKMKKIISLIIILCLLFSTVSAIAYAEEDTNVSTGFINTVNLKTNKAISYQGIKKNACIYMLPDDIATIGGYVCEKSYLEREEIESFIGNGSFVSKIYSHLDLDKIFTNNKFEYLTFSRNNTDYITQIFYHSGYATTMGKTFEIDYVNYDGETYLNLEKVLYLMHAQWCVEDNFLYYYPLGNNIFDFIGLNFNYMSEHSVQHSSLLMNDEGKWAHSTRIVVSHIFNDIDMRIFIPFYGDDLIQQEWYKEAILQLATTDDSFIDDYGSEQINKYLKDSSFQKIKTGLSSINTTLDIIELPSKISETKLNRFSKWNDLSTIDTEQLKDTIGNFGDVVSVANILVDFNEIATRSKEWGTDFVNGLNLLSNINEEVYGDYSKDIIKVSEKLLDEFHNPAEVASASAMFDSYDLILNKLFDKTATGQVIGGIESIITLSNAIIKSNPDYAKQIENADLMNTVHSLINVENIFLSEFVDSYHEYLQYFGVESGSSSLMLWELLNVVSVNPRKATESKAIFDLRNSLEMFLKTSLRNKTFVYHFNSELNDMPNWEDTDEASELKKDIYKTYALLSELISTRDFDELLYLDDSFEQMHSDKYGFMRTKIDSDILTDKAYNGVSEVVGNGSFSVGCDDGTFYWEYSGNNISPAHALIFEDNNGNAKQLYNGANRGEIYLLNNTLIVNQITENPWSYTVVVMTQDGKVIEEIQDFQVVGLDNVNDNFILFNNYHTDLYKTSYYNYNVSNNKFEPAVWSDQDTRFLDSNNGVVYFYKNTDDNEGVIIYSYDVEKNKTQKLSTSYIEYYGQGPGLGPGYGYSPCTIYHFQATEASLYYSYGFSGGSGNYIQKAKISMYDKLSGETIDLPDISSENEYRLGYEFYVYAEDNVEKILYYSSEKNANIIVSNKGKDSVLTDKLIGMLGKAFTESDGKREPYWIYPDDSGEIIKILPPVQVDESAEYAFIENVTYTGTYAFYDIDYHKTNPKPNSWRDYTITDKLETYRYNNKTGERTLIGEMQYSYD